MRTTSLSLLTFNTLGTPLFAPMIKLRYERFSKLLNEGNYDILCLQEVTTYYHLSLLKKNLTKYPYRAYKKFLYGPKGGIVIFSKVPLENVRYDSFTALGSLTMYTQLVRNGILSCTVKDLPVRILNTHLITDFEYKASTKNRFYKYVGLQIEETAAMIEQLVASEHAVITVGDFNVAKNDAQYKAFLKQSNAIDLFKDHDFPTYYKERYKWRFLASKSVRIDYIFLNDKYDRIQIKSTEHVFKDKVQLSATKKNYLSDHIGLLTNFVIRK